MLHGSPRWTPTAAIATLLAVVAVGCGGGDDGAATTAAARPLTHATLVERANAACARAGEAVAQVPVATSIDGLAGYAERVGAIGATLHAELGRLTPPAADRPAFDAYVDGVATSNRALAALRTAAAADDADGVQAAARDIDGTAVGVLATRAGLSSCATATQGTESGAA